MNTVTVLAEAGVNHGGSLERACALVDAAAAAGADAVKFQTFRPEALVSGRAPKAEYQKRTTDAAESQLEMLRGLVLSDDHHRQLVEHCRRQGIAFLSTPFDLPSLAFLARTLDLPRLKIGSGELTDGPLLLAAARTGKALILSTGMAAVEDVRAALGVVAFGLQEAAGDPSPGAFEAAFAATAGQEALARRVTLLHCTTAYPAPAESVNLRAMETLHRTFSLPVGFSDHSEGIEIALAAVALGARVIEKHFTLDRNLPGPDHRASLEPDELAALVRGVRRVETALGDGVKEPTTAEIPNIPIARKSLTAARNIRRGEPFTAENLTVKRPGTGLSPLLYWQVLGRPAPRTFVADELIEVEEEI